MAFTSWREWLKRKCGRSGLTQHQHHKPARTLPRFISRVEPLEDRTVLSALSPIVVNTLADTVNSNPNVTSLREAIEAANKTPGADVIQFAPSLLGTITLDKTLGELDITDDVNIVGPGAGRLSVSGNDAVRVFDINPGVTVTISGLTITHGLADANALDQPADGGGILNQGKLTLAHDVLSNNKAAGVLNSFIGLQNGAGAGGGVANLGTLTVTGSTFIDNHATGADGSVGPFVFDTQAPNVGDITFPGLGIGGGLWNGETGQASVTDSRFIDNVAQGGSNCQGTFAGLGQGGGIANDNKLSVTRSSFIGNQAVGGESTTSDLYSGDAVGGAVSSGTNEAPTSSNTGAELMVSQSAFSRNEASGGNNNSAQVQGMASGSGSGLGGGIFVFQGTTNISRSALDGNMAKGGTGALGRVGGLGIGGGIVLVNFLGEVTGAVDGCVILQNEAIGGTGGDGGAGGNGLGGGLAGGAFGTSTFSGSVTLSNTLVAANFAQGGTGGSGGSGGDGLGGGLFNDTGSTLVVTSTAFASNQAIGGPGGTGGNGGNGLGGGIFNGGTATLIDSIIAGNRAGGGAGGTGSGLGGGLYNNIDAGATVSIDALTVIFGNIADEFSNCFGC
jgi:CSLREA domain-containing protein